ncbi:multiple sugar transport system permease protein/raffinose/stachyose/melibiose transport system permease protein [Curtobacterium sp. PhB130]|uniref:carbohydrate ABC transporter permease n=1 Tax=Curtobacterium sp. PhB130 TaxID=2485178 RepID=UPI000F4BACC4|nr:sugar ABC transporter permease [Curtobacterium sp. PhB130]ROS75104.1 multiple sugar transport system permease protein/raffinose/stachyose/melibiose transport system permease protein [Curtobacterium sp. PhB130]
MATSIAPRPPRSGERADAGRTGADGTQPSAPAPRPRKPAADVRKRVEVALLAGPATIMFVAFVILPVGLAAYYGFYKWQGYGAPTDFVGLDNYKIIFTDPDFRGVLWHNLFIVIGSLLVQGPIAIILALLLNQRIRGRGLIRVLIFVPYVISEVIVGTGWSLMLSSAGAANDLLQTLGLGALRNDWLSNPDLAIWTLLAIISWKYIGFAVILFLAGLQSIPEELFEAAQLDGAGYWQIQRRITLPLLGPTLRIWAFLSIIGSLQLFDLVYIIWGQYIASTAGTSTMATYMVANGRNSGNYGYGNAVAVVIFLISLVIALVYQRFVLRRDTAGALTEKATR